MSRANRRNGRSDEPRGCPRDYQAAAGSVVNSADQLCIPGPALSSIISEQRGSWPPASSNIWPHDNIMARTFAAGANQLVARCGVPQTVYPNRSASQSAESTGLSGGSGHKSVYMQERVCVSCLFYNRHTACQGRTACQEHRCRNRQSASRHPVASRTSSKTKLSKPRSTVLWGKIAVIAGLCSFGSTVLLLKAVSCQLRVVLHAADCLSHQRGC